VGSGEPIESVEPSEPAEQDLLNPLNQLNPLNPVRSSDCATRQREELERDRVCYRRRVDQVQMTNFDVVWIAPLSVMAFLFVCALVILIWIEPRSRNRPH
jgi:hypothetical protein